MPGAPVDEGPNRTNIITALFGFRGRLNRTQYALLYVIGHIGPLVLFVVLQSLDTASSFVGLSYLLLPLMSWVMLALLGEALS
jgi:hypothetical protein